jgi:hypothetical protein
MTYKWTFGIVEFCFPWHWKNFQNVFEKNEKEFTSFSARQTIDSLLCNLKRQVQITSSTTFVKIVYYCALKYQYPLDVVAIFFYQDHNTLAFIIYFKKLFIFYFEIIAKNNNILVKFTFSIYNQ